MIASRQRDFGSGAYAPAGDMRSGSRRSAISWQLGGAGTRSAVVALGGAAGVRGTCAQSAWHASAGSACHPDSMSEADTVMELVAYVDREGAGWPPAEHAIGERVVITVTPDTLLNDAVARAVAAAGGDAVEPIYYWVHFLRDRHARAPEYVALPRIVVTEDGQALWTEAAKDLVTFADLIRARDAGFLQGDPLGLFLEQPMYGDGILGNWLDLFEWLGAIGGTAKFLAWLKARYSKWEARGARSPFAFLDMVLIRDEWAWKDLARLLGLSESEAIDLLEMFGYEPVDVIRSRWRVSTDPERSALRQRLLRDQLHREDDTDSPRE